MIILSQLNSFLEPRSKPIGSHDLLHDDRCRIPLVSPWVLQFGVLQLRSRSRPGYHSTPGPRMGLKQPKRMRGNRLYKQALQWNFAPFSGNSNLLSLLRGQFPFPFPWLIQASDSAFQLMESSPFPLKSTHLLSTLESLFHTHRLEHLWLEETNPRHVFVIPNSEISALSNLPYTYISYTYDLSSFI